MAKKASKKPAAKKAAKKGKRELTDVLLTAQKLY